MTVAASPGPSRWMTGGGGAAGVAEGGAEAAGRGVESSGSGAASARSVGIKGAGSKTKTDTLLRRCWLPLPASPDVHPRASAHHRVFTANVAVSWERAPKGRRQMVRDSPREKRPGGEILDNTGGARQRK